MTKLPPGEPKQMGHYLKIHSRRSSLEEDTRTRQGNGLHFAAIKLNSQTTFNFSAWRKHCCISKETLRSPLGRRRRCVGSELSRRGTLQDWDKTQTQRTREKKRRRRDGEEKENDKRKRRDPTSFAFPSPFFVRPQLASPGLLVLI